MEKQMTNPRADVSVITLNGKSPQIHDSAFIAPGCRIIGDVTIGAEASIWYNCVIRAEVNRVVIGARTNIQDGSIIHCDGPMPGVEDGFPTIIGDDVLVGHNVMLHGCILHDRAFVGLSATVMNGAVIEGDVDNGSVMAGQSVGMVKAEESVQQILDTLTQEAEAALTAR
jgi:carbonic anhydrase/acetyltransferase-like protein (isoleucine patch superfamily)